jgi:hypothetical protein
MPGPGGVRFYLPGVALPFQGIAHRHACFGWLPFRDNLHFGTAGVAFELRTRHLDVQVAQPQVSPGAEVTDDGIANGIVAVNVGFLAPPENHHQGSRQRQYQTQAS